MRLNGKIGVGVIGANSERGWAAMAHIPALKALSQYEIVAVSTSRTETARRASQTFGVLHAFADHRELVSHPSVDLVIVTVKVPRHRELVEAAISAGKHVFCEWPLGRDAAEAQAMATMATSRGVRTAVGLQARFSPAIQHVRRLICEGYVGRVLSTTVIGSGMSWNAVTIEPNAYVCDRSNGATMLSIPVAHTIDAICWVLGEFREIQASVSVNFTEATVCETGARIPKDAEDQVVIAGRLEGGATIDIHYRGGSSRGTNLLWEINGTEGDLLLTAPSGQLQFATPTLHGGRAAEKTVGELSIPPECRWAPEAVPSGPPLNVAQAYVLLAQDLSEGTVQVPTFAHAVERHRFVESAYAAARTGQRQIVAR